jgi:4-amino-4-deoxy-L-arabinose transferase-like glycosyltransferase
MSYPQQPGNWSDPSWPQSNQPYSDPGYAGYPGYQASAVPASPGYGYGPQMPVRRTNGLAIAAMVVSLASLLVCGWPAVVGAIMGHVARRQIRERGEDGDGMALTGIIVGWIVFALSVGVTLIYIIFFVWLATSAPSYTADPTYT